MCVCTCVEWHTHIHLRTLESQARAPPIARAESHAWGFFGMGRTLCVRAGIGCPWPFWLKPCWLKAVAAQH
eukprot:5163267-Lingulodinium_polyedra.AAC.1